uniref:Uncharacterized protein n=1 Tax=Coturnix japonica TaxID=93934 RepID=A0A8C2TG17_COTJA
VRTFPFLGQFVYVIFSLVIPARNKNHREKCLQEYAECTHTQKLSELEIRLHCLYTLMPCSRAYYFRSLKEKS